MIKVPFMIRGQLVCHSWPCTISEMYVGFTGLGFRVRCSHILPVNLRWSSVFWTRFYCIFTPSSIFLFQSESILGPLVFPISIFTGWQIIFSRYHCLECASYIVHATFIYIFVLPPDRASWNSEGSPQPGSNLIGKIFQNRHPNWFPDFERFLKFSPVPGAC